MFHRCRYKAFGSACNRNGITEVDVICPKCNKVGTLTIHADFHDKLMDQIVNNKYLRIPSKYIIRGEVINWSLHQFVYFLYSNII